MESKLKLIEALYEKRNGRNRKRAKCVCECNVVKTYDFYQ